MCLMNVSFLQSLNYYLFKIVTSSKLFSKNIVKCINILLLVNCIRLYLINDADI